MGTLCLARRLAAAGLFLGLAILADPPGVRAGWPQLWGSSKPKVTVVRSEPVRPSGGAAVQPSPVRRAVHESAASKAGVTPAAASAQKSAAPYEEDVVVPGKPRRMELFDPCDDPEDAATPGMTLEALVALGLEQNPRLAKVTFGVEVARGRAYQAGLYPNPTVALMWDELGDKTGRAGVNGLPFVTQEIVMGRKLKLSRAAAEREVEQASWGVMAERYAMLSEIRTAYFDVLALQERVRMLCEIRRYGRDVTKTVRSLRDEAKQLADIDVLPVEAELARYEADVESAQAEKAAAYKRLAALLGVHRLEITKVAGRLEDYSFPDYDAKGTPMYVLSVHPEIQIAQWGVEKARFVVQRAKAEPIPNLSIDTGYVRQNQNNSDDYRIGVSASIPLFNRNQGNIRAAEAELCAAIQEVGRVENDLTNRVATALREFAAARKRAEKYQAVVSKAEQAQTIATEDQRRNLSPLMVLELQRSLRQARLERLKSVGDTWKAAAAISGLAIEDNWPSAPAADARQP
ncbi:MAG: TolC family protein [Planctomycetales bacterium]|nr:TolC family protein [Planctomycetales bacterium]